MYCQSLYQKIYLTVSFNIVSYNTRGLHLGQSVADKSRRLVVENLFQEQIDILCLQETWLAKQDLNGINNLHPHYHGIGESTTDLNNRLVQGRIPGGVALLWHTKYEHLISEIRLNVDWAIGIQIKYDDKTFVVINIYTPYECLENESDYLDKIAFIAAFISEFYVVGDWNADISDDNSLFANHLKFFCSDNNYILSSLDYLPPDSYTYVSDAWHTTSWLDHCICTADADASVGKMEILYQFATTDHIPVNISIDVDHLPGLCDTGMSKYFNKGRLDWSNIDQSLKKTYHSQTEILLNDINVQGESFLCRDPNCVNKDHAVDLCNMYDNIVKCLCVASESLYRCKNRVHNIRPGWNEHVADLHSAAREAHLLWVESGKNRLGSLFEFKERANARFKYALRFIKNNENVMRADSIAHKTQRNSLFPHTC